MKIIKQGIAPSERKYRATCSNCDTIFEFQRKEATYISASYRGDHPALVSIECPTCKTSCNQNEDNYLKPETDIRSSAELYYSK